MLYRGLLFVGQKDLLVVRVSVLHAVVLGLRSLDLMPRPRSSNQLGLMLSNLHHYINTSQHSPAFSILPGYHYIAD